MRYDIQQSRGLDFEVKKNGISKIRHRAEHENQRGFHLLSIVSSVLKETGPKLYFAVSSPIILTPSGLFLLNTNNLLHSTKKLIEKDLCLLTFMDSR